MMIEGRIFIFKSQSSVPKVKMQLSERSEFCIFSGSETVPKEKIKLSCMKSSYLNRMRDYSKVWYNQLMFTGLIREMATVSSFSNNYLTLKSTYEPKIGDSIAINGTCLTVVRKTPGTFTVELSPETQKTIAMENLRGKVHMEPAMQLSDRLEGHIVQGHIDTIGKITKIEKRTNATDYHIKIPKKFMKYIIPKGSIAVDGISLTVNDVYDETFRLTIIPHTLQNTLFADYKLGTRVNIETDMFARYLYHMFSKEKTVSWDMIDSIMASY